MEPTILNNIVEWYNFVWKFADSVVWNHSHLIPTNAYHMAFQDWISIGVTDIYRWHQLKEPLTFPLEVDKQRYALYKKIIVQAILNEVQKLTTKQRNINLNVYGDTPLYDDNNTVTTLFDTIRANDETPECVFLLKEKFRLFERALALTGLHKLFKDLFMEVKEFHLLLKEHKLTGTELVKRKEAIIALCKCVLRKGDLPVCVKLLALA